MFDRVAVNVELLLAPALKAAAVWSAVTPPDPEKGVTPHCIRTDWNTGAPTLSTAGSAVRMLEPLRRRHAIGLPTTPLTSVASARPRRSMAAALLDAAFL